MKNRVRFVLVTVALASLPLSAATKDVKPGKMTCEEFVALEEAERPQVVYFIEGAARSGKKEDMVVSIDEVSKPVAWVLDECNKAPKATVWQKVENYVRKATRKL